VAIVVVLILWLIIACLLIGLVYGLVALKLERGQLFVGSDRGAKPIQANVGQTLFMTSDGLSFLSLSGDVAVDPNGRSRVMSLNSIAAGSVNASAIRYDPTIFAEARDDQSLTIQLASIHARHIQLGSGLTGQLSDASQEDPLSLSIDNQVLTFTKEGQLTIRPGNYLFSAHRIAYAPGTGMTSLMEVAPHSINDNSTIADGIDTLASAILTLHDNIHSLSAKLPRYGEGLKTADNNTIFLQSNMNSLHSTQAAH
jgi:hypothetical protein